MPYLVGKNRDKFTVALHKDLVRKKLSHKNNSKLSSMTSFPFSPSKVLHHTSSNPPPLHTLALLSGSFYIEHSFIFSLFSHSHLPVHSSPLPLFQMLFTGAINIFQVPLTSLFLLLYLLLTEQTFRIVTLLL